MNEVADDRRAKVERAIKGWTDQLIDLSGNNKLLYYRTLKAGTLDLTPRLEPAPGAVSSRSVVPSLGDTASGGATGPDASTVDRLRRGDKVRLSAVFPNAEERKAAARRLRTIAGKALENLEERGIVTLYVAWGMATWTNETPTTATPRAPIFLLPVVATRSTAAGEDFDIEVDGDTELNPTLVHLLATQFKATVDSDGIMISAGAVDDPLADPEAGFAAMVAACAEVPGFEIDPSVVLANFSFTKMPMVKDLQANVDALVEHDLVAALAGVEDAIAAVHGFDANVPIDQPDLTPPADEFLVLPADSSQNHAINRVLAGESLVIQGPPGTGKSQTIANLIASSIARGEKVLFVAEKRAAIDAVMKRMADTGLDNLVLDLHSHAASRTEIMRAFADAIEAAATVRPPDVTSLHRSLTDERSALLAHAATMSKLQPPWGISLYDLQAEIIGSPEADRTDHRVRPAKLALTTRDDLDTVVSQLREYLRLRALDGAPGPGRWAGAPIWSEGDAARAQSWAEGTESSLAEMTTELSVAAGELGVAAPTAGAATLAVINACAEAGSLLTQFNPEVFTIDAGQMADAIDPADHGGFGRLRSEFRSARKAAEALLRDGQDPKLRELHALLGRVASLQQQWTEFVGPVPIVVPANLDPLIESARRMGAMVEEGESLLPSEATLAEDLDALADQLALLVSGRESLYRQPRLRSLEQGLRDAGFDAVLDWAVTGGIEPDRAGSVLRHAWLRSVYDATAPQALGGFDGALQDDRTRSFRAHDQSHLQSTPARIARLVAERSIQVRDRFPEQAQALAAQTKRKRGIKPTRTMFRDAPDVMLALKPCWTMSPLLVAQMLPGDKQYFDLVVFDEASQVTPADAMSAILRAPQIVVAGDSRQLPPTAFFATDTTADLEVDEDESDQPDRSLVAGFESLLDVGQALLSRAAYLGWHYRSRDERLIAFSNEHIYDRRLTTFPGAAAGDCLAHQLVDSTAAEEARVAQLVLDHARSRPKESLGVIAMGIKHAERVDEAVRSALASAPDRRDLDRFFSESASERFFVKNLERVQGDERDAIILTTGYGRGPDGRMRYNFGPINNEGGERRLNVAITRARSRVTAVTSFRSTDLDPAKTQRLGPDLLRRFLHYVESGGEDLGTDGVRPAALNPFEIEVRDLLVARGIPLHPQYGVSSYRLDFAAAHPDQPGRMVLAIECDGASYHSSPTARDRDRLRQEMLERLGWRFHRIWSTDWFRDRDACADRALEAWTAAVARVDDEDSGHDPDPGPPDQPPEPVEPEPSPARAGPKPVAGDGRPIAEYTPAQLIRLVTWIKSDGFLRTREELVAEAIAELGYKRRGSKIVAAVERAVDSC